MTAEKLPVVESKWSRVLEYCVFAFPVMLGLLIGAGGLASLRDGAAGSGAATGAGSMAGVVALGVLLSGLASFVLAVAMAVSLYFDAKLVNDSESEWSPSPVLYAVGGFFLSGLVSLHYLYERYDHLSMPEPGNRWWYGVATSLAFTLVGLLSSFAVLPVGSMLVLSGIAAFLLPVAIYKDAAHVRENGDGWTPNPVTYFLLTFFTFPLLVVPPLAGAYYLFKRNRHVGLA